MEGRHEVGEIIREESDLVQLAGMFSGEFHKKILEKLSCFLAAGLKVGEKVCNDFVETLGNERGREDGANDSVPDIQREREEEGGLLLRLWDELEGSSDLWVDTLLIGGENLKETRKGENRFLSLSQRN